MKKIFIILCSSMIILSANKCELGYDGGRRMSIYNNSGKPICYEMLWKKGIFYPDTILPENNTNPHPINKEWHFSLAYTENTLFATFPTDTMSIFFFDPDTLAKYDWQIIRSDYKILVRYDFSHNDLNMLNWCIYYPPIEEMRNMKMYPPYE